MSVNNALGKFQITVGSTTATNGKYIVDDNNISVSSSNNTNYYDNDEDEFIIDSVYYKLVNKAFDLDSIMVNTVYGEPNQGVKASHLSKIWRIDENIAKHTLDITTQRSVRKYKPKLSHTYGTTDRMLRYKHLKEYFYMDTLFATSKSKNSSRSHTYAQVFVADNFFIGFSNEN